MMKHNSNYNLELTIGIKASSPTMMVTSDPVETEQELQERVEALNTAIHWLTIKRDDEIRFWKYKQKEAKC